MRRSITSIVIATGTVLTLGAAAASPAAAMPLGKLGESSAAAGRLLWRAWYCRCEREWAPRLYWQWGWHHPPWQTPWNEPTYFWSLDPPRVPAGVWARKWHRPRLHRRRHDRRWTGKR